MTPTTTTARDGVASARRIVVKIGTRVLVQRDGRPDARRMRSLVQDLAALRRAGRQVVVVSSGAVGAGMQALKLKQRPKTVPDLQMAAAVGQSKLMATYDRLFAAEGCRVGQMLLTHDGLKDRERHLNARNTLMNLLRHDIIPIVNENDVVSVEEIKFGDNDMLAALVSLLMPADLLVLLTTADGLREPAGANRTRRIDHVQRVTPEVLALVNDRGNDLSTGGMRSKLGAARMVSNTGIPVVIANGRKAGTLQRILEGASEGTLIGGAAKGPKLKGRKRWIAFFHKTQGAIQVDDGARAAMLEKGKSLLPIGIRAVDGRFPAGALVDIRGADGEAFARGLTTYGSEDLAKIKGRKGGDLAGLIGPGYYEEVVHRDNMVIL